MKILFLTPFLPYPPRTTNRYRAFHLLESLGVRHEITLVSFVESADENRQRDELLRYCKEIITVVRKPKVGAARRIANVFQEAPYFLKKQFESLEMSQKVQALVHEKRFDLIHVSTLAMAQFAPESKGVKKILDLVDCNTRNYLQQWQTDTGFRNRALSYLDWRKIRNYEPKMCEKFDCCTLVNPVDRQFLSTVRPGLSLEVLPAGVDLEYFKPAPAREEPYSLIFTGTMNYAPNSDAMRYFCGRILPLIEKKYSQVTLHIVGANGAEKFARIASRRKNIIITGFLEDVRAAMAHAAVVICPLRLGTGIKNKVLEAMAMGKAIVSSSIGVEGIRVTHAKDAFIADTPQEFAEHVIGLFADSRARAKMGENARTLAQQDHRWELIAQKLNTLYDALLS